MDYGERFAAGGILLVIIVLIVNFTEHVIALAILAAVIYSLGFVVDKTDQKLEEKYDNYQ